MRGPEEPPREATVRVNRAHPGRQIGAAISIVPFVQSHLYLVISLAVVALIGVILFVYLRLRKAR